MTQRESVDIQLNEHDITVVLPTDDESLDADQIQQVVMMLWRQSDSKIQAADLDRMWDGARKAVNYDDYGDLPLWMAPDTISSKAMALLTGPVMEVSSVREWSTADLENVRGWLSSLHGRTLDTIEYITRVLADRRDAENKNKAAADGHTCGDLAFKLGKMRAPYLDDSLRYLLKQYDSAYHTSLFENWLHGWDSANLASAEIESPI